MTPPGCGPAQTDFRSLLLVAAVIDRRDECCWKHGLIKQAEGEVACDFIQSDDKATTARGDYVRACAPAWSGAVQVRPGVS